MRYASFFRLIECTTEKNLHMQSIVNCLFIKGKEMTQAEEILKLRLLMLFTLIEQEFSNKRWKFLQEALSVGERINNPGRSNKENCQKITQTGEIFCKRCDTEGVGGVRVMVKGDWDSLVCFGGTLWGFLFTENMGIACETALAHTAYGSGSWKQHQKIMELKYKSRKKELGTENSTTWKTSVKWVFLLLDL